MTEQVEPTPPTLDDIGTRHQHLQDHLESLEMVRDRLVARGEGNLSLTDRQKLMQVAVAADVTKKTIDAFLGLSGNTNNDYQLYRLLNSVPAHAEDVPSERGTPLC